MTNDTIIQEEETDIENTVETKIDSTEETVANEKSNKIETDNESIADNKDLSLEDVIILASEEYGLSSEEFKNKLHNPENAELFKVMSPIFRSIHYHIGSSNNPQFYKDQFKEKVVNFFNNLK